MVDCNLLGKRLCSSGGRLPRPVQKQARALEFFTCENSIDLGLPFFGLWDLWQFWSRSFDCHVFGVDPPAIGFRCSYGWRAFAALLEQVRFMATEPHVITRCLRAFLHLPGLATIQDLVDAKGSSVGPANSQRVNSPLIGYVHDNANVHLMYARPSSLFHLVVHAIYYRTIVR